jgi:hypothetical protein
MQQVPMDKHTALQVMVRLNMLVTTMATSQVWHVLPIRIKTMCTVQIDLLPVEQQATDLAVI